MKKYFIILAVVFMFVVSPSFVSAFSGGHHDSDGKWGTAVLGECQQKTEPQACGSTVGTQTKTTSCVYADGKDECNPGTKVETTYLYTDKIKTSEGWGNWIFGSWCPGNHDSSTCDQNDDWRNKKHRNWEIEYGCPSGYSSNPGHSNCRKVNVLEHYINPQTNPSSQSCTLSTPDYRSCPVAGTCPTECGVLAGTVTVADGHGGLTSCPATNKCEETPDPTPTCNPAVNLIQNGGFETPAVTSGGWSIVSDTSALNWLFAWVSEQTTGTLGLEIQNNVAGAPFEGSQLAELDGDHPVTIWQDIPTIVGETYKLNFSYSPRAGRDASDNEITVKAGGSTLGAVLSVDGTENSNTVWTPETRTFTATSNTTKIEFTDTGTDTSFGGYLDNVTLYCQPKTPETCTYNSELLASDPLCVAPTEEVEDVCANIPDIQETLPEGMQVDSEKFCEPEKVVRHSSPSEPSETHDTPKPNKPEEGKVLGASTTCSPYLNAFIKFGDKNNNKDEVKKLQEFLNEHLGLKLKVDGVYGKTTFDAVKAFQLKYNTDVLAPWIGIGSLKGNTKGTGYVYKTTQRKINLLKCPELDLPMPTLN